MEKSKGIVSFRGRLLIAMMLLAVTITGAGLYLVQRRLDAETAHERANPAA